MAGFPNFSSTPVQNLVGAVGSVASAQNPDGTLANVTLGRQGELVVGMSGGDHRQMSSRGGVYMAAATSAGITIPINTTTSGSTFCLVNPIGSGVLLEPIDFTMLYQMAAATFASTNAVVLGFSFVNTNVNLATAVTKIAVPTNGTAAASGAFGGRLDKAANLGFVASAITFASALTVAANWGYPLFSFPASWVPTVGGFVVPLEHNFKGKILLPPGYAMTLCTSVAATTASAVVPVLSWAEYLV